MGLRLALSIRAGTGGALRAGGISLVMGGVLIGMSALPLRAQDVSDQCAGLAQADEIQCLRKALAASQAALSRAQGPDATRNSARQPRSGPPAIAKQAPAPRVVPSSAGLGAEQVVAARAEHSSRAKPEKQALQAIVTRVETNPRGEVTLHLNNGQVWRQAELVNAPLVLDEKRTHPVEISSSGFGGYRMRFLDIGRQIAVRRIQ